MSRAFVKEAEGAAAETEVPERQIDSANRLATARGLQLMEREIARLEPLAAASPVAQRDLHYWQVRRQEAQLAQPLANGTVQFASLVKFTLRGKPQRYQLVGTDEADPTRELLSYASPLGRALLGAIVGDVIEFNDAELEVLAVE